MRERKNMYLLLKIAISNDHEPDVTTVYIFNQKEVEQYSKSLFMHLPKNKGQVSTKYIKHQKTDNVLITITKIDD